MARLRRVAMTWGPLSARIWGGVLAAGDVADVLRGSSACRMTWHRKLHGELLQHTSRGVVLVVAAGLTLAVSGYAPWCNTCGVTTRC